MRRLMNSVRAMKTIITLLLVAMPFSSFADCMARAYSSADGEPKYKVLSCINASTYIQQFKKEHGIIEEQKPSKEERTPDGDLIVHFYLEPAKPTEEDKAVELTPVNASARSMMNGHNRQFWLFKGQCSALPLNKAVTLNLQEHCSDMGPTLYSLFGDMTVKSVKQLYE
jgi:hypothetical protein